MAISDTPHHEDDLLTFKQAAWILGIPYFKIQRAAKMGLIPTYSLLNSRKYVKLSDIRKVMSDSCGSAPTCNRKAAGHEVHCTKFREG